MVGATVQIVDPNVVPNVVIASGLTDATGVATVTIPPTTTGPFVVNVICDAACSYYDEKAQGFVNGSAATPPIKAVVPGLTPNATTLVGVTVATNAAANYALSAGVPLTAISVAAVNSTVAVKMGLPAGTNILTPPTIISDPATYKAAQTGTTPANQLANLSAAYSFAASGVTAIQAIANYGTAWQTAATNPASGVIMPPTINTAALTAAASGIPVTVTPILNVASAVATTTAITNRDSYLADLWAGNLRDFMPGSIDALINIALAPTGQTTSGTLLNGVTTLAASTWQFLTRVWTLLIGSQPEKAVFILGNLGWYDSNAVPHISVVGNPDGSMTRTVDGVGSSTQMVNMINLAGTPIAAQVGLGGIVSVGLGSIVSGSGVIQITATSGSSQIMPFDANGMLAVIPNASGVLAVSASAVPLAGTFAAGATAYQFTPVGTNLLTQDVYFLHSSYPNTPIDGVLGLPLTSMAQLNADYCMLGWGVSGVRVVPNPLVPGSISMYSVLQTTTFNPATGVTTLQCPAVNLANPLLPLTPLVGTGTAAIRVVNGQQVWVMTAFTPAVLGGFNPLAIPGQFPIMGSPVAGKVHGGTMFAVGTPNPFVGKPNFVSGGNTYNKAAMDAIMTAGGLPVF